MKTCSVWVIAVLLPIAGFAQGNSSHDEMLNLFKKVLPQDTISNPKSFQINGFHVESSHTKEVGGDFKPTGREMDMLLVTSESLFEVGIEKGRETPNSGGIAIFHRQTGTPMLTAGDRDGDGRIDTVMYSVVDEHGDTILDVTDYDADGQADLRVHFKDHYFEVWHKGRWYRAVKQGDHRGIVINGEFVELQKRENRWIIP